MNRVINTISIKPKSQQDITPSSLEPSTDEKKFHNSVSILLNELADLEKSVEMSRNELVSNKNFCATKVFNYLDIRKRGYLDPKDIRLFLEKNSIFVTQTESELLFNNLDFDKDGKINWQEYLEAILTQQFEYQTKISKDLLIGTEMQEQVVNIFMNELEGLKIVEKYKHNILDLESDQLNLDILFEQIDEIQKGFLDVRDIYDYLKTYSNQVAYVRAERVLRRLDGDGDGKINFDDWINGMIPESKDPNKYELNEKYTLNSTNDRLNSSSAVDDQLQDMYIAQKQITENNLKNIETNKSHLSIEHENMDICTPLESKGDNKTIQGLDKVNISFFSGKGKMMELDTSKKNHNGLVGGLKKQDVDNQMTQRGKVLGVGSNIDQNESSNFEIEKYNNRLAQNGQNYNNEYEERQQKDILSKSQLQMYLSNQNSQVDIFSNTQNQNARNFGNQGHNQKSQQQYISHTDREPLSQTMNNYEKSNRGNQQGQIQTSRSERQTYQNNFQKLGVVSERNLNQQDSSRLMEIYKKNSNISQISQPVNQQVTKNNAEPQKVKSKIQIRSNTIGPSYSHSSLNANNFNLQQHLKMEELKNMSSLNHQPVKIEIEKILGSPDMKQRITQGGGQIQPVASRPLNIGSYSIKDASKYEYPVQIQSSLSTQNIAEIGRAHV